ncbi:asparagine synthase (glutamine-hydrolysing) [Actinokineospora alba]|uniref:asparagine synthase (glutamine-hydrolyzing) n=1 Tax=Actinokineospora alba TaxID=504798 RepID=A0A1H0PFX5_9PSEU|nr:asparagine synthase (glutamine-hydrolyzing) [Actinokineospora alba]TDP65782.1 asparagine synthase (glutamine-hydrolysing) [Actinokineospora alba]SDI65253.1 asparagine synthase (glutamine-hydrolysing) [Actinokineospora alba]SDP03957.1 asparagine synthase (glutamine-hydrolysing) [Actinokineospora alba]
MCGIAGIRRLDGGPVDPELLAAMGATLHHRGPDDSGVWFEGSVGFAHTRLSIIDLDASVQPMESASGRQHLAFNGEILNYRQLRTELPDYPYRTKGDTETLLALYDKHGVNGTSKLRGQFAYALHDAETGELHLVRDRMGILPLYYYADDKVFAFASEIKALYPVIGSPEVDQESLHDYLAHRSVPAPFTLVKGVRKVPQGHRLTLGRDGQLRLRQYWEVPVRPARVGCGPAEAVELVAEALDEALRDALVADVPVGAYLSGGVDSSLITALIAKARDGADLHTFSAGFGDARVDEVEWARKVADIVGSKHHEVIVTAEDFRESWTKLSWHRDAPLSEPADVAVFKLAELARRDVKVVLSGEGSDELFGGYPKYRFARATRWAGLLPALPRGAVLRRLEQSLPAAGARLGVAMRAMAEPSTAERMRGWFAPFTGAERTALLGEPATRSVLGPYQRGRGDALHRMLYADSHSWLADNLLERGDRMSMAASLELRPPFMDHRVVELAFSLPSSVKVRNGVTKWVVKEVARRHLPADVVDRKKAGFRVPLDAWFRGGLRDMAHDLLTGPSSFAASVLEPGAVRRLLAEHDSGSRNEQPRLWTLLSLEVWHRGLGNSDELTGTKRSEVLR